MTKKENGVLLVVNWTKMTSWVTSNVLDYETERTGGGCDNDSEVDCMVEDKLQTNFLQGMKQGNENDDGSLDVQHQDVEDELQSSSTPTSTSIPKNQWRPKRKTMWTDQDGTRRPIHPRQTFWYCVSVSHPDIENPQFHKTFRLRFCLPYAQFQELFHRLETEVLFARWHEGNVNPWTHDETTPLSLLLLTALRYLGRGWTFDDLSENMAICQETIRVFFHTFVDFGSTVLYTQYIRPPQNCNEARQHTSEYTMAGFPGAIGSTDATHIMLERVQYRLCQTHIGFKMSHTARTYNITINHCRQILATTTGHPARWNDKTLALFDNFMTDLKDGNIMNDMHFDLYENTTARVCPDEDTIAAVTTRRYQGAWLLVDNGYLAWSTTVPPIKTTSSRLEIRFLLWLESMRKDVECPFGILKGRWRILKTGIRLSGVECADKIFLTCCALHNWLLEIDGLANNWNNGTSTEAESEWNGALGEHDPDDNHVIPRAIMNLHNPVAMRTYDLSGMGPGSDAIIEDAHNPDCGDASSDYLDHSFDNSDSTGTTAPTVVRKLPLVEFRKRLITHFDIAYQQREIKCWPSSARKETSPLQHPGQEEYG